MPVIYIDFSCRGAWSCGHCSFVCQISLRAFTEIKCQTVHAKIMIGK